VTGPATAVTGTLLAIAGVIGAIIAVFKLSPERQSIFITTAQGAVVVQSGVIDDLRDELERLRQRITACEEIETELVNLRHRIDAMQDKLAKTALERDRLKLENDRLKDRVATLEAEVAGLKNGG
jgi:chromosome segregation ATPase